MNCVCMKDELVKQSGAVVLMTGTENKCIHDMRETFGGNTRNLMIMMIVTIMIIPKVKVVVVK